MLVFNSNFNFVGFSDSCAGVDCGPGKDCKVVAFPCVVPPCPESFKCVSRVGKGSTIG